MNKIGFAIKITREGAGQAIAVNGGDWVRHVVDIRDQLKHIPLMAEDYKRSIIFFSFDESGCYITVAHTISGRVWDNVAGWIYIPSSIVIDGGRVNELINQARMIVHNSIIPDETELRPIFSQEYELRKIPVKYQSSNQTGGIAKRDTGIYSIQELMGEARYQSYYSNYKYVFLTDEIDSVVDATDLTHEPLKIPIILFPPTSQELYETFGASVTLKLSNGRAFQNPIQTNKDAIISLSAEREGFEPIYFPITAENDGQTCPLPRNLEWKKRITTANFKVITETGEILQEKARIWVNGVELSQQPMLLTQRQALSAEVSVKVKGYEPYTGHLDLWNLEIQRVRLQIEIKKFEAKIDLKNGHQGKITVSGPEIDEYESPIQGYAYTGRRLEYQPEGVWKNRLIGFAAAAVIVLVILLVNWFSHIQFKEADGFPWFRIVNTEQVQEQKKPEIRKQRVETTTKDDQTPEKKESESAYNAVEYLDTHDTWVKEEMINFTELKNLYEEMNSYDFEAIKKRKEMLGKSSRFMELIKVIEDRESPMKGQYNQETDTKITLSTYIDKIKDEKPAAAIETRPKTGKKPGSTIAGKDTETQNPQEKKGSVRGNI